VTRSCSLSLFVVGSIALALPLQSATAAARPAVARPILSGAGPAASDSTVFFVKTGRAGEVAAVGTAHSLNLPDIARVGQLEFLRGNSHARVASSTAFLVPPGRPFRAPGGTLAGDYFVYALNSPPQGSDALELETKQNSTRLHLGQAVHIRGIPTDRGDGEIQLQGRISQLTVEKIRVEFESSASLRGWGGAPVISDESGRVIGIVQANEPGSSTPTIAVAPISELRDALLKLASGEAGPVFTESKLRFVNYAAPAKPTRASNSQVSKTERSPILLAPENPTSVHLEIEFPADGAVIPDSACGAFVAGRAMALRDSSKRFDVALVLDTSGSTMQPTGADINGNGVIGMTRRGRISSLFGTNTDDGDSILAAEVAAARQILRDLDPRTTRVAVVTFAGGDRAIGSGPPAITRQPLTHDYSRVELALDFILRTDPVGNTHISGAVDHTVTELLGLFGSSSSKDRDSEKLIFFLTDGFPTLPYGALALSDNIRAVRRSAERAHKAHVRIHSFAIGPEALGSPIASVELADYTGGSFIPVRHPGELEAVVDAMSFANLENVTLRSATTGDDARPFRVTADGSWGGFLKMVPGLNTIEIAARSADGSEAVETLRLIHEPAAVANPIPRDLGLRHNRLLEDCLRDLKQMRVAAEQEHAEKVRGELLLEIEEERAKARQRAAEQRKQLKLEVE
jgi:hypothetical protein